MNPAGFIPRFDYEFINNLYGLVLEGEKGWAAHFEECKASPVEVFYEDLVGDFPGTIAKILDACRLPPSAPIRIDEMPLKRQADSINDEWAERYLEIRQDLELSEPG